MVIYVDFEKKQKNKSTSVVMEVLNIKNKADNNWVEFIKDCSQGFKIWSDSTQREFRKRVNGCSKSVNKETLYDWFYTLMPEDGYRISSELSDKGFKYLWDQNFKKNGSPRKNAWGSFEQACLKRFSHFTFSGLYNISQNSLIQYVPVYRVWDTEGNSFEYTGVTFEMSKVLSIHKFNNENKGA